MNRSGIASLMVFMLITCAAGLAGSMVTASSVVTWYPALHKPSWTPPPWLFGPVWTFLYVTIAISGWLVWREAPGKGRGRVLAAFIVQLALNGLWSFLFFGLKNPGLAFADIMALWLGIVLFIRLSWGISRTVSLMLLPYLCWVSFAAVLNCSIWVLNAP